MVHPCGKPCGNKTASGYCATTACINPQYSNLGTAQYGQGVQKRIVSNADRIRSMTDEELALYLDNMQGLAYVNGFDNVPIRLYPNNYSAWLDWLKREAGQDAGDSP